MLQLAKRKVDEEDAPLRSSTLVADMVMEVGRLAARQEDNAADPTAFLSWTRPTARLPPHVGRLLLAGDRTLFWLYSDSI